MSHILFCSLSLLIFKTPILIGSIGRNRRAWSQRSTGMYYAPCPNRCVVNLPFNDVTGTSREPWPAWTTWTNWTACEPLNSLSLSLPPSPSPSIFLSYSVLTHHAFAGCIQGRDGTPGSQGPPGVDGTPGQNGDVGTSGSDGPPVSTGFNTVPSLQ